MSSDQFPKEDEMVTAITVRDGNARVLAGTIVVAKPRGIVVTFETPMPERGQVLTLLYGSGERVLRLRTRVVEVIGDVKVLVEPEGGVTEGERREFLRASRDLPALVKPSNASAKLPSSPPLSESKSWPVQSLDLSGSGVSFTNSELADKGEFFEIHAVLDEPEPRMFSAIGEVVRCLPSEGDTHSVAIHFTTISEDDRDAVINYVFRRYYASLAEALHGPS